MIWPDLSWRQFLFDVCDPTRMPQQVGQSLVSPWVFYNPNIPNLIPHPRYLEGADALMINKQLSNRSMGEVSQQMLSQAKRQRVGICVFLFWGALFSSMGFYGCFRKWWYPQIIQFNRDFHYKSSILGYPYFGNTHMVKRNKQWLGGGKWVFFFFFFGGGGASLQGYKFQFTSLPKGVK